MIRECLQGFRGKLLQFRMIIIKCDVLKRNRKWLCAIRLTGTSATYSRDQRSRYRLAVVETVCDSKPNERRDFPDLSRLAQGPTESHVQCLLGRFLARKAAGFWC